MQKYVFNIDATYFRSGFIYKLALRTVTEFGWIAIKNLDAVPKRKLVCRSVMIDFVKKVLHLVWPIWWSHDAMRADRFQNVTYTYMPPTYYDHSTTYNLAYEGLLGEWLSDE